MTEPQPIRDDTQEAFSLTGAGPLTQGLDAWSDMHRTFNMPAPRPFCPRRELVQRMVAALMARDDAAYDAALDRLIAIRDGNTNSGPTAPIQGQE